MANYFQKELVGFLLDDNQKSCDIVYSATTTETNQPLEDRLCNFPIEKSEILYQLGIQFFKCGKTKKCYADAIYCFKRAVKLKHKEANNLLGFCYMLGVGVDKNENEAITCFQEAADAGSSFAYYNLALLKQDKLNNLLKATEGDFLLAQNALGAHYYNDKKEDKRCLAPKLFRSAMSQDAPLAQYNLGLCYYYGIGVEPDYHNYHIAVKYFASAASNDLAYAQNMLGVCYAIGRGVDKNLSMAIKYFQQASSNKHANASFNLAMCYLDSENEQKDLASEYMRLAAEEGCVYAIYNRGIDFYYGRHGTKQDYVQAVKCFEMANVLPEAKNMLGVCYATGRGTAVHLARAAALFTSAASSNNLEAIYNLGLCHLLGIYYIQSASNAQNYFIRYRNLKNNAKESGNITDNTVWDSASNAASMADDFEAIDIKDLTNLAKTGLPDAQFELGKRFAHGINVAQDFAKSIRWWQRAASQGHAQAQYNLGCCYLAGGKGVSIDIQKAREFLRMAASQGDQEARYKLISLDQSLSQTLNSKNETRELGKFINKILNSEKEIDATNDTNISYLDFLCGHNYITQFGDPDKTIGFIEDNKPLYCENFVYKKNNEISIEAAYNLGMQYCLNENEEDFEIASVCLYWAVLHKHQDAMFQFGHLYATGKGIKQRFYNTLEDKELRMQYFNSSNDDDYYEKAKSFIEKCHYDGIKWIKRSNRYRSDDVFLQQFYSITYIKALANEFAIGYMSTDIHVDAFGVLENINYAEEESKDVSILASVLTQAQISDEDLILKSLTFLYQKKLLTGQVLDNLQSIYFCLQEFGISTPLIRRSYSSVQNNNPDPNYKAWENGPRKPKYYVLCECTGFIRNNFLDFIRKFDLSIFDLIMTLGCKFTHKLYQKFFYVSLDAKQVTCDFAIHDFLSNFPGTNPEHIVDFLVQAGHSVAKIKRRLNRKAYSRDDCYYLYSSIENSDTPGIDSGLYNLMEAVREKDDKKTSLPQPKDAKISENMELEAQKYAYSQTHVPFLSIPMRDVIESGWSELTISDLNLSPSLSDALKYNNFYEFDEFSLIESTTVEYLWRLLGNVHFQKIIEHLDQCGIWKNKKYQIASELLVDKKWAELSIPKSLVDVGEYAMLQKEGIISWADYNQYITTPHIIDSNFIAICHFQVKYATEIIHFQKLLDGIVSKSADQLFLASLDIRSRMIYKSRFIDGNTLDVIAVSTGLTKERIRQITKQQDEQLKISTPIALPLTELSALYLYLECFIEDIRGVANQEFFLEQLDSAFHCDQQYLQLILHFCELNFNVTTEKTV